MNNLKDTSKITFAAIGLCVSLTFGAKASALQDAGDPPPASPPPTETEKEKVPKSPPSLDDLLGIEGEDEQDGTQDAARREIEEELQRELNEEEIRDAFRLALEKMDLSAELLDVKFDPGLGTQRIQEDIIAKLQQLIDQAKKQNSPQGSSSSPQSDQKPKDQNQKPGKQEGKQDSGSQRNKNPQENQAGNPPPPQDASLNTMIEESRSEWGNLPERIRSMLLQGRKGKYSSLYEKMTSEYYKRLAEDKPH